MDGDTPPDAGERGAAEPRQQPTLDPEEVERIAAYEELEDFIEEKPQGELGVIADEDVPGAPG